ncbi:MAG: bifunctional methylenetetrahydrofolate dehydrogenase/methenyltetrahydrofolate cyclohydrolase FolD [Alphaproteobacteria bacterium]|nr:bifunctional methylenetetrahydrofolate dehydrogenase/methenyltetrahydrofolate cyclohydrolase FolD [Alphaproteobacteria bacterium]
MSQATLIDGKATAARVCGRIGEFVAILSGRKPGLAVVLVGEDPASQVYVRNKKRSTEEVGMFSIEHKLPAETSETDLLALVQQLNADSSVDGILVQLPLPKHLNSNLVVNTIDPGKDVDGFHVVNAGKLAVGDPTALVPCTPFGCLVLLRDLGKSLSGQEAVVVGRSNIVGKPMAALLLSQSCTVTIAHSRTKNLAATCRGADILVAAVGRSEMIPGGWVKPGATVIDVGINRIETESGKTQLVGDVHFDSAVQVAGAITPVPGGVGPMTIAMLLQNTLRTFCIREGVAEPEPTLLGVPC